MDFPVFKTKKASDALAIKKWRKCMGIERTRQLVTGTLVLKLEPYVRR